MSLAICPLCGASLEVLRSTSVVTLSCSKCDWNCASARHVWRRHRFLGSLYVIFGLATFAAIPFMYLDDRAVFLIGAMFVVIGAVICSTSWRALQSLRRNQSCQVAGPARAACRESDVFFRLIPSYDEVERYFPGVLKAAEPRSVKPTWRLWLGAIMGAFLVAEIGLGGLSSHRPPLVGLVVLAVFCALFGWIAIQTASEWNLLKRGEVTPGRVVFQQAITTGKYSSSIIFYAFLDSANHPFIGECSDGTWKIKEGEPIIVFYKRSDPGRNVALHGTDFRVSVTPQG